MTLKIFMIALGGAAGRLSRYWLSGLVQRLFGATFPLGTFAVNVLGCLIFGFAWSFLENRVMPGSQLRLFVITGFLGAFTTFSTYMFETASLVKYSDYLFATLNVAGQTALGLTMLFTGLALGRLL